MYLGAAWYPEHWSEERWPEDVRLMHEAGMNVCRIAEFAWSSLEPHEGQYKLDWLDRAVDLLHWSGLAVVIGTPTAAPPAWLTHRYPDTLLTESSGRPAQHGNRQHYSPTSHTYHKYARRIAEQLARRFGPDERVIGWQIDNEYARVDYSEATQRQFQTFLREQYGSLDALNAHWSTAYWSQTYTDWHEIPIPIGPHNPGLMLAFRHFVTHVWRDFQKLQVDAIRQYARPEQWITHNFMGWFDVFDHYALCEDLTFASWDWYIGTGHHNHTITGIVHDLTRGFKRRNFWIMETQPGNVNWSGINTTLDKGEARCMAWHGIAHGADAVLYWQWRSALGGQEQLHGTCLGADGKPRPFYSEVQQLGRDFEKAGAVLDGTTPQNQIALLHSYDARWSLNAQRHHKDFDPVAFLTRWYRPFAGRSVGADVISTEAALDGYKLVIAPALVVLSETTTANLTRFVENGGTLVLTVRCGQKDVHNALFPALQPGPLRELAGVEVADYYALEAPVPVSANWDSSQEGTSELWAEWLRPLDDGTTVLAQWGESNGWLDGQPAMTLHNVGANGGRVIYVGAVLNDDLQCRLTEWLLPLVGVSSVWPDKLPQGVEVARRLGSDGRSVLIIINHMRHEAMLDLPDKLPSQTHAASPDANSSDTNTPAPLWRDLLTGDEFGTSLTLPGYGVRVFAV